MGGGLEEGVGDGSLGDDPFGGGEAAADVEVEFDGVFGIRVLGRGGGGGGMGVFEVEGMELGVKIVD